MVFCGFLPRLVLLWMHISAVMWLCGLLAAVFEYIYMYMYICLYEDLGEEKLWGDLIGV